MIKKTITFATFLFCVSLSLLGQTSDSSALNEFKEFLPFILKNMGNAPSKELDEKTIGEFYKPWNVVKLETEEVQVILSKIEENQRFRIEKDYTGEWKLSFFSKLQDFETIKEIYNSNGMLSNVYVSVSEINILNGNGVSIYVDDIEKTVKYNEAKELNFNSGQIHTTFPINGEHADVSGSIKITLNEYSEIHFKNFDKVDQDIDFDLREYNDIKLLKIEKNRAYFILPTVINDIEIEATNQANEKFTSTSKTTLPKKIYDFGMQNNKTDEAIDEFIENLSFDDVFKNEQILIYETNGKIESLYIYLRDNAKELGSKTLKIKL